MTWDWQSAHADRLVAPEEAVEVVKSGDEVVVAMASPVMTPVATVQALVRRAPELRDLTIDTSWTSAGGLGLVGPEAEASWSTRSAFVYSDPEYRGLAEQSPQTNYVPLHPSFMGTLPGHPERDEFTRRYTAPDVFMTKITPPNRAGFVTFGSNLWNARAQSRHARVVIGEVDPTLPIIPGGDNWMPVSDFDYLVEAHPVERPPIFTETPEEEVEPSQLCGYYTADLINNGDTVMFGGGAMPVRLAPFLEEKEDLGCHTEVICPLDLVRNGVINGSRRNLVPGKVSLTGLIPRTPEEREWIDGNPLFDLRDMELNNNPKYIAQNDNMVAVNAPLEVTIWGEIGCERVGPRYFRGVGGQVEFVVGALLSKGGRSIHSVLSRKKTANGEWVSTIVPEFTPPGVASISRQFADIIVTEYGVARLQGKTERERAGELIAIAHPDFRPQLAEAAKRAFGLGRRTFAGS